jgi:hypothetical protein
MGETEMKTIKIVVTEQDIKEGHRGAPDCCPIALAARRHPEFINASVNTTNIYDGKYDSRKPTKEGYLSCRLPDKAIEFIEAFDDNFIVQPIEFDVPLNYIKD